MPSGGPFSLARPLGVRSALAIGVILVVVATLARLALGVLDHNVLLFPLYFPAVLVAALLGGRGVGTVAAALSIAVGWFLFLAPSARVDPPSAVINLVLYAAALSAIVYVAALAHSLFDRLQRSEARLVARTRRYDALMDSTSEGLAICEAIRDGDGHLVDYVIEEMNPALRRMLGVGPETIGARLSDGPVRSPAWMTICQRVLDSGKPEGFEFHNRRTGLTHEIHVSRVTPTTIAQFFFDITERKQAQARQAELFDELNHRVKNNLSVVSSVLQLQARASGHPVVTGQLMKAVDRVQSIAQVHEALYKGGRQEDVDFGLYIEDLCGRLSLSLLSDSRVSIEVMADHIAVPVDKAIALGMIVNELVTNAVKYAYPPPRAGAVTVRFASASDGLVLTVSDRGPGLPTEADGSGEGLGMKLVRSLVSQLPGQMTIDGRAGVLFEIRLPHTSVRKEAAAG